MNRRQFLASACALTVLPQHSRADERPVFLLRAEAVSAQILPEGDPSTQMLGFNGSMPGPEIRVLRGQPLSIDLQNGLDDGTAVH